MTRNLLLTLHITAVTGWLGADILQYVIASRLRAAGRDADLAWTRTVEFLHARYYAVVTAVILLSGIGLVFERDWPWSSRFVWVGIGSVLLGGALGGGGLRNLAAQRVAALEAGDTNTAAKLLARARPLEIILSLAVVLTILAMVSKWGAS